MNKFEDGDNLPGAEEFHSAEDQLDLCMPDLMAEAAEVKDWDQTIAFNFIRRAYARGKADGIREFAQEIEDSPIE